MVGVKFLSAVCDYKTIDVIELKTWKRKKRTISFPIQPEQASSVTFFYNGSFKTADQLKHPASASVRAKVKLYICVFQPHSWNFTKIGRLTWKE